MTTRDFLKIIGIDPNEIYSLMSKIDMTNMNYILLNSLKMNYDINHSNFKI